MRLRSLYAQLFSLFGATFVLAGVLLWTGLSGGFNLWRSQALQNNLTHYGELLAREIGVPPDPDKARDLSARLSMEIFWWGPWGTGSVSGKSAPLPPYHQLFVTVSGQSFLFAARTPLFSPNFEGLALALPLVLSVLLGGLWILRRLLAPLRRLTEVASALGQEGWDLRIPVEGEGDLAALARTFNSMADRIEGYWKSRQSLLGAVSHELRSPLTRMRVALEFVGNPELQATLLEEVGTMNRITEILLERERLARRPDLLNRSEVEVGPWVDEVLEPFVRGGLSCTAEGDPIAVGFDRDRMSLVLVNLVENVRRHAPGSPVWVRWAPGPHGFHLSVEDRGPGIPREALGHWGEPFERNLSVGTAPKTPGHGLGSSLARSVVEAHGGRITLEVPQTGGLRVHIVLP